MNKRIGIVRPDSNPYSKNYYNSQEIGLAKGLSKQGVDVDIFMVGTKKTIQKNKIAAAGKGEVILYELPCFVIPEIMQAIFPALIKTLAQKKYDLIQVNEENELTNFMVARYAKRNNIKCIVYQGMYQQLTGRVLAAFQKLYDIFLLPHFKKNIFHAFTKTTRAQQHLIGKGFKNVTVIPVGLDIEPFRNAEYRDWKSELSIPEEAHILLYIGTLEERRNIHFLVDIAKKLKHKSYILLIAGNGPLLKEITERIDGEQIENVLLLGQVLQKHIKSLYEIADYFLLASNYEIYGMVVLEALYCGCPVISTPTAGPEDLIRDGKNGFLIDNLNADSWVNTILDNSRNLDRSGITEHVQAHLTWDVIANKYLKVVFGDNI